MIEFLLANGFWVWIVLGLIIAALARRKARKNTPDTPS